MEKRRNEVKGYGKLKSFQNLRKNQLAILLLGDLCLLLVEICISACEKLCLSGPRT